MSVGMIIILTVWLICPTFSRLKSFTTFSVTLRTTHLVKRFEKGTCWNDEP